eukprot:CAMPEP_0174729656 /NCGR_PEP_ID=MMETSP1094-20130205/54089_1 /TAXON_ID=156173 /ORGANISM="Chrysochromulina brevifilum, Strain UTEX LB 985" /LENGTH=208 /DNA_ID=CAMNT_0015931793 /DNA_START=277 /DNA_END=903 /DNA_ORIENTATION=+
MPAMPWLRRRMAEEEWKEFIAAYDAANLVGTIPCHPVLIIPCTFPLLCCQPLCCFLPFQYEAAATLERENAINLVIAKYNRYLFMPRGMLARRQKETHLVDGDTVDFPFLRIEYHPPGTALARYDRLKQGVRPGSQRTDLQQITRDEFLATSQLWPQADKSSRCAWRSIIGEPRFFFSGDEPEIEDPFLEELYAKRRPAATGNVMQRV